MIRTSVFKFLQMTMAILLVLAVTLGVAGTQSAQAAPSTLISGGWMPFAGSLQDAQTNSNISVNGLVHILARWQYVSDSQVQVDITANLPAAGVSVTTDTGIPYSASGGGTSSVFLPPSPIFPTDPIRVIVPSFLLVTVGSDRLLPPSPILPPNPILPPSPIKPYAFAMQLDLVFSAAGVLDLNASTVQIIKLPGFGDG